MFLRGVAWFGVVVVMWEVGALWRLEWWSRRERGSSTPFFFFAWWCFAILQKETFLGYLNDVIQFMLFSSPPLLVGGASPSSEGNLIEWFTHLNSGQWLNPSFNPSWATHIATSKEGSGTTQMTAGSNVPPPKRRKGRKHHHPEDRAPNGGGDKAPPSRKETEEKASPPTRRRKKQHQPKGWRGHFWGLYCSLPPSFWVVVFSTLLFPSLPVGVMLLPLLSASPLRPFWVVVLCPHILLWRVHYVLLDKIMSLG